MKVAELFGHVKSTRTYKSKDTWVLPFCCIGLEFEYENITRDIPAKSPLYQYFTLKEDGSLRDRGAEFVLSEPMFGEDLYAAIDLMCGQAKKDEYTTGYRTSTHVHLDVRDMEHNKLHNLAVLYSLFERLLFEFVGIERAENNFCVPWYRSSYYFDSINSIDTGNSDKLRRAISNMERYSALNFAAVGRYGSLEFRHCPGLSGKEGATRLIDWINIIMALKKAAQAFPQEGYNILLEVSKVGPRQFTHSIFGNLLPNTSNFDSIWDGIQTAQELLLAGKNQSFEQTALRDRAKTGGLGAKWASKIKNRNP